MHADIEAAVQWVLARCQQLDTAELRSQLERLKETNAAKQAQRAKIDHLRQAKADLERSLHEEYDHLRKQGALDPEVSYDDFAAVRDVHWQVDAQGQVSASLAAGWRVPQARAQGVRRSR